MQIYFAIRFTKTAHLLLASFGTKSLAVPKAAAEMVSGFQCLLGKNIDIDIELSHIYDTFIDLLGTVSRKKSSCSFGFCPIEGRGGVPCPNFLSTFHKVYILG